MQKLLKNEGIRRSCFQLVVCFPISFYLLILVHVLSQPIFSQPSSSVSRKAEKFNSILFNGIYSSNSTTFGQSVNEVNQPSYSGSGCFFSRFGFDLSILTSLIENSDSSLSQATWQTDLSGGYMLELPWNLYSYAQYSYSLYSGNSESLRSNFKHLATLETGYNGKFFNGSLTGMMASGDQAEWMLNMRTGINLEADPVFRKDIGLAFQPEIDFLFGKQQFYNEYLITQISSHPYYWFRKLRRMGYSRDQVVDLLTEEKKFTVTAFYGSLPVTIMVGKLMITGSFNALKPLNQSSFVDDSWTFFAQAGISWFFMW